MSPTGSPTHGWHDRRDGQVGNLSEFADDLRKQIASGSLLVIVGAGVSMGATDNPVASWTGLLSNGAARAHDLDPSRCDEAWRREVDAMIKSGDVAQMLIAAERITEALKWQGDGEFRRWLNDTVGTLQIVDRSVLDAISRLGVPIATTNYDNLLEQASHRERVTWLDGPGIQRVFRGDDDSIAHLHGHFREPQSVVLGVGSYEAVLRDRTAQDLLKAVASMKSLVLIGFGAGIEDPNFAALRDWLRTVLPDSPYRHFRLCLNSEIAAVREQHGVNERIVPVGYGDERSALAGFIDSIGPPRETKSRVRRLLIPTAVCLSAILVAAVATLFSGVSKEAPDFQGDPRPTASNWAVIKRIRVGTGISDVAVSRDGLHVYTANGDGTLSVIAASTNEVTKTVRLGGEPAGVAVTPTRIYVSNYTKNEVQILDTETNELLDSVSTMVGPGALVASPDAGYVYVTHQESSTVTQLMNASIVKSIPVGEWPTRLAISPTGEFVYTANTTDVSVIQTSTDAVIRQLAVPLIAEEDGFNEVEDVAVAQDDESRLFILDRGAGSVVVKDTSSYATLSVIDVGEEPDGLETSPDGRFLYVILGDATLVVVDTVSNSVVQTVELGGGLYGLVKPAVSPDGTRVYVASDSAGLVSVLANS